VPHRIAPGGNLTVLRKTSTNGKGSERIKKVDVVLKARERTKRACRPGSSTDTVSVRLTMVNSDNGEVIFEEIHEGLTCDRRLRRERFMVHYEVEDCEGSVAPSRTSKNEIKIIATTEDGTLLASRNLKCNK
jgi:hypothetical protein